MKYVNDWLKAHGYDPNYVCELECSAAGVRVHEYARDSRGEIIESPWGGPTITTSFVDTVMVQP